jgi:hypothetical protein
MSLRHDQGADVLVHAAEAPQLAIEEARHRRLAARIGDANQDPEVERLEVRSAVEERLVLEVRQAHVAVVAEGPAPQVAGVAGAVHAQVEHREHHVVPEARRRHRRIVALGHEQLLELDPRAGEIRFAGQRAVLLDAATMGILRKYLVEHLGLLAARSLLTQFGFAHGWRMAEAIEKDFRWETPLEWQQAGLRVAALQGLFELDIGDPLSRAGATMRGSYEAEQHVLNFGKSEIHACWSIAGLISGYLSRTLGADIFVLEDRCVAKGDACCHLLGRSREEWGEDRADDLLHFSSDHLAASVDASIGRVVTTLKTEARS